MTSLLPPLLLLMPVPALVLSPCVSAGAIAESRRSAG